MTIMIKNRRYFVGLTIETKNFAFEVKVILRLEILIHVAKGLK